MIGRGGGVGRQLIDPLEDERVHLLDPEGNLARGVARAQATARFALLDLDELPRRLATHFHY